MVGGSGTMRARHRTTSDKENNEEGTMKQTSQKPTNGKNDGRSTPVEVEAYQYAYSAKFIIIRWLLIFIVFLVLYHLFLSYVLDPFLHHGQLDETDTDAIIQKLRLRGQL
jgi:hypothetical protein